MLLRVSVILLQIIVGRTGLWLKFLKWRTVSREVMACFITVTFCFIGPGRSSGKALGYGLDGPDSIPGVGGVEIFLSSFVSRLVL